MELYLLLAIASLAMVLWLMWEVASIRRHLSLRDLTPSPSWKKRFNSHKHRPRRLPDRLPHDVDEHKRRFFEDTRYVIDWLNEIFAETPWSFENEEATGMTSDRAVREIAGWYNEARTCRIALSSTHYEADGNRSAEVEFSLLNCRAYDGMTVINLAQAAAALVCHTEAELTEAQDQIQSKMIDAMWQVDGDAGNRPLDMQFSGQLWQHVINWRRPA